MELDGEQKDGSTLRGHLRQAEKATGKRLIKEPEVNASAERLWSWFWELSAGRPEGFSGAAALTFSEIKAWAELTGHTTKPWEVQALKAMDAAYLKAVAKLQK